MGVEGAVQPGGLGEPAVPGECSAILQPQAVDGHVAPKDYELPVSGSAVYQRPVGLAAADGHVVLGYHYAAAVAPCVVARGHL